MITVRIGNPSMHRRVLGPVAARRLDARLAQAAPGASAQTGFRGLADLEIEPDGAFEEIVAVAALCGTTDVDAAIATIRRVLRPGGTLRFLEHGGRPSAWRRLSDRAYASLPWGCHVGHDVPAALRRGGFDVTDLERFTMPSAVPLLRHWTLGIAR